MEGIEVQVGRAHLLAMWWEGRSFAAQWGATLHMGELLAKPDLTPKDALG